MKTMRVKIIKVTGYAWYNELVGQVFTVSKIKRRYHGGMGYKCVDRMGGILVKDCEVLEDKQV